MTRIFSTSEKPLRLKPSLALRKYDLIINDVGYVIDWESWRRFGRAPLVYQSKRSELPSGVNPSAPTAQQGYRYDAIYMDDAWRIIWSDFSYGCGQVSSDFESSHAGKFRRSRGVDIDYGNIRLQPRVYKTDTGDNVPWMLGPLLSAMGYLWSGFLPEDGDPVRFTNQAGLPDTWTPVTYAYGNVPDTDQYVTALVCDGRTVYAAMTDGVDGDGAIWAAPLDVNGAMDPDGQWSIVYDSSVASNVLDMAFVGGFWWLVRYTTIGGVYTAHLGYIGKFGEPAADSFEVVSPAYLSVGQVLGIAHTGNKLYWGLCTEDVTTVYAATVASSETAGQLTNTEFRQVAELPHGFIGNCIHAYGGQVFIGGFYESGDTTDPCRGVIYVVEDGGATEMLCEIGEKPEYAKDTINHRVQSLYAHSKHLYIMTEEDVWERSFLTGALSHVARIDVGQASDPMEGGEFDWDHVYEVKQDGTDTGPDARWAKSNSQGTTSYNLKVWKDNVQDSYYFGSQGTLQRQYWAQIRWNNSPTYMLFDEGNEYTGSWTLELDYAEPPLPPPIGSITELNVKSLATEVIVTDGQWQSRARVKAVWDLGLTDAEISVWLAEWDPDLGAEGEWTWPLNLRTQVWLGGREEWKLRLTGSGNETSKRISVWLDRGLAGGPEQVLSTDQLLEATGKWVQIACGWPSDPTVDTDWEFNEMLLQAIRFTEAGAYGPFTSAIPPTISTLTLLDGSLVALVPCSTDVVHHKRGQVFTEWPGTLYYTTPGADYYADGSENWLATSRSQFHMAGIEKYFWKATMIHDPIPTGATIDLWAEIDGKAPVYLGTASSGSEDLTRSEFLIGTTGSQIALKVHLSSGLDTTMTPIVYSMSVSFFPEQSLRMEMIVNANTAAYSLLGIKNDVDPIDAIDNLFAVSTTGTPCSCSSIFLPQFLAHVDSVEFLNAEPSEQKGSFDGTLLVSMRVIDVVSDE